MKKTDFLISILIVVGYLMFLPYDGLSQHDPWRKVDDGLFLAEFDPLLESTEKGSKIVVMKIDPGYYSFKLLCASEFEKKRLTPKEWSKKYNLISTINAGMYQKDGFTNVGYMKNFSHLNNPRLNSTYKAVLAFNRTDLTVPEIQIIDLKCQDFEGLKFKYQTFIQNIRMISCKQENVWSKQDKKWSLAALGIDKSRKVLFILSEAPCSGYDFNNILLSLPISIFNTMYLEGGPEASLYLSTNGVELDKVGVHETSLEEIPVRPGARPIPNVIGITKKTK